MPEGESPWFLCMVKVERGVLQGCVLDPTMFIILLEFCKRMAGLKSFGIRFACVKEETDQVAC
jgi:hypothetical protein